MEEERRIIRVERSNVEGGLGDDLTERHVPQHVSEMQRNTAAGDALQALPTQTNDGRSKRKTE